MKDKFLRPRNYKPKHIDERFNKLIDDMEGNTYEEKRKFALQKKVPTDKQTSRVIGALTLNELENNFRILNKIDTLIIVCFLQWTWFV